MAIAAEVAEEEAVVAKEKAAKRRVGGAAAAARARHAAAAVSAGPVGAARFAVGLAPLSGAPNTSSPTWSLYLRIVDLFRQRFGAVVVQDITPDSTPQENDAALVDAAWVPIQIRLESIALSGTDCE